MACDAQGAHLITMIDRRPLAIRLSRLDGNLCDPFRLAVIMGIVADPDSPPPARDNLPRRMFQLTPTLVGIAPALISGRGLPEIAEEFGIADETARTHRKNILRKTGLDRQSEPIAMMARAFAGRGVKLGAVQ